jgi:hypothetical protein
MPKEQAKPPREVVLINRIEGHRPDLLTRIEQFAKILSLIGIPVVVGAAGWVIQSRLAQQSVSQQYVQIAIAVLTKPKGDVDAEIRDWAARLLNDNSPTKMTAATIAQLKSGEITLPGALGFAEIPNRKQATAKAADGSLRAQGQGDGSIVVSDDSIIRWTLRPDGPLTEIDGLQFSPDNKRLCSFGGGVITVWSLTTGKAIAHANEPLPVNQFIFSPSGDKVTALIVDGHKTEITLQDERQFQMAPSPEPR